MPILSFKDLDVWQMSMTLAEDCYYLTATFPTSETYSMTAQKLTTGERAAPLLEKCQRIGKMLRSLTRSLQSRGLGTKSEGGAGGAIRHSPFAIRPRG